MRCRRCGFDLKESWGFCPKCGARKGDIMDSMGRDIFSQLFNQMKGSFAELDNFDKDLEALDLSPWFRRAPDMDKAFRPVQKKGFSVHIKRGTGMKPQVHIKTYGDVNKERIQKELQDRFGVKQREESRAQTPRIPEKESRRFSFPAIKKKAAPKSTEEPKADVRRIGDKVSVDIMMPGVRSQEDVDVKELESSVEVKAIAGDKAYFKILTKPAQFRLSAKSFRDGQLHLEFS
jgi:HSP20 family molecular chaperone IbpA